MTRAQYDAAGANAFDEALRSEYLADHPARYRDVEFWRRSADDWRAFALVWWSWAAEAAS